MGVARLSSVKEKNLGESCRAKKLVILNKPLKFKLSKVEPNCSPFYMREAPGTAYGGISIKPISGLSKLLQLVVRRTCLAVSAVLTTDHLFWLERPFSVRLLELPHILPHVRNTMYFY